MKVDGYGLVRGGESSARAVLRTLVPDESDEREKPVEDQSAQTRPRGAAADSLSELIHRNRHLSLFFRARCRRRGVVHRKSAKQSLG